ncbi:MAG: 3-dehydroquinate synthase family protein [Bacteroidia bacterium]
MAQESTVFESGGTRIFLGAGSLEAFVGSDLLAKRRVLVLTDANTERDCLPILRRMLPTAMHLSIPAGESAKSLAHVERVWEALTVNRFERGDLVIHLGGGMVCDLGGFAASTYKRGIPFVQIPTTLLALADASVGGKTGINFLGYKNQIGAFSHPLAVVADARFLGTLPERELRSGYAEVLKHCLLDGDKTGFLQPIPEKGSSDWDRIIETAIRSKLRITEQDPTEKGIRKALNLGHTVGHAVESHFLETRADAPLLHGEAVALGLACEAWIAWKRGMLGLEDFELVVGILERTFGWVDFGDTEIAEIAAWALQDKKNQDGRVNCSLLRGIGAFEIDQWVGISEIEESLGAYLQHFKSSPA